MTAQLLADRYRDHMVGTLSCHDRIVITAPCRACYAEGITSFLQHVDEHGKQPGPLIIGLRHPPLMHITCR